VLGNTGATASRRWAGSLHLPRDASSPGPSQMAGRDARTGSGCVIPRTSRRSGGAARLRRSRALGARPSGLRPVRLPPCPVGKPADPSPPEPYLHSGRISSRRPRRADTPRPFSRSWRRAVPYQAQP
jgi:hypothetical protein